MEKLVKVSGLNILLAARDAFEEGNAEKGSQLANFMIDGMRHFAETGKAEQAVSCELLLYRLIVKFRETDDSGEEWFSKWRDVLHDLGRRERDESLFSEKFGVGMVFQTLYPLAHVDAVYNTLKLSNPAHIYVIGGYKPELVAQFKAIGCGVTCLIDVIDEHVSIVERLKLMRSEMAKDGIGVAVWISTPSCASFAFGMGLARLQVMWSHRNHAFIPGADLYIAFGDEKERTYHGKRWQCARTPLIDWQAIMDAESLGEKPREFTFGVIARHEKMEIPEYLDAVSRILKACPEAHFEFCGKYVSEITRKHFIDADVWARCHFAAWVDPARYVGRLSAYLESFPSGGVCSLMACAKGVPVTVMKSDYNPLTFAGHPVADGADAYVEDAIKIYRDHGYRQTRIDEGRKVIDREISLAHAGARRFWDMLNGLILSSCDS